MATNTNSATPPSAPAHKQAAAKVMDRVLGADVVAALHEGFLKGDLTGVVPLLAAATAKPYLLQAAREAFVAACEDGEAVEVALLLEGDGVDGNVVVNPDYEHDNEDNYWEDNEEGDTVLTRAARNNHSGVMRALLERGKVDVNAPAPNGERALVLAMQAGAPACVEVLFAAADVDTTLASGGESRTALMAAADAGNLGWVERCLAAAGVDASAADRYEDTALILAAENGSSDCLRAIVRVGGVDVNQPGNDGGTALWWAACNQHTACVRALLAMDGVDMNRRSGVGASPLLMAIPYDAMAVQHSQGWEACARALASAKHIDINHQRPRDGQAALHKVCTLKSAPVAAHLLAAGGCRFARDKEGRTPLDCAAGDKAVLEVFASGVDYWRRKRHGGHAWVMKEVVKTLLLVRQHLDALALAAAVPPAADGILPHLPEEIWLAALGFLRSADFMP